MLHGDQARGRPSRRTSRAAEDAERAARVRRRRWGDASQSEATVLADQQGL